MASILKENLKPELKLRNNNLDSFYFSSVLNRPVLNNLITLIIGKCRWLRSKCNLRAQWNQGISSGTKCRNHESLIPLRRGNNGSVLFKLKFVTDKEFVQIYSIFKEKEMCIKIVLHTRWHNRGRCRDSTGIWSEKMWTKKMTRSYTSYK